MNSLYIIGNGFDIAHKVDTRYWNFRTFLEEKHWEFLQRFESLYHIQPLDPSEYGYSQEAQERWNKRVDKALWSEFERFMAMPDIQSMLDYSESVVGNLGLESGNYGIRDTMDAHWRQEFGFIRELQKYVKEWIEQIDLSGVIPRKKALIENDSDYFFNFNYTRVLEDVYRAEQVLHIHGSVSAAVDLYDYAYAGIPAPPSYQYDIQLQVSGESYTVRKSISQVLKPGEIDRFNVRVFCEQSSQHTINVCLMDITGRKIPIESIIQLDMCVPRSGIQFICRQNEQKNNPCF